MSRFEIVFMSEVDAVTKYALEKIFEAASRKHEKYLNSFLSNVILTFSSPELPPTISFTLPSREPLPPDYHEEYLRLIVKGYLYL